MTRRAVPFSFRPPLQSLALLAALGAPARAQVCFAAELASTVDRSPVGILHADLDGDGDQDLVTVNEYRDTISVLLNHGDGTLVAEVCYPGGLLSTAVVSADFDGDGDLDLAVSNHGARSVSVLLNHGDGTFAPRQEYRSLDWPQSLTAADLDGDGAVDLVTIDEYTGRLAILLNQGAGTFGLPTACDLGTGTVVLSADMDSDGDVDLVVGGTEAARVLANQGNGTFVVLWEVAGIWTDYTLACADLDGDGHTDLVAASYMGPVLTIRNLGGGAFAAPVLCGYTDAAPSVNCADLDNDGDLDLVLGTSYHYRLQVLLNLGTGVFVPGEHPIVPSVHPQITCADLDGDGDVDLGLASEYGSVTVVRNQGNASFPSEPGHGVGRCPTSVVSGDLDGDGDMDLAVANLGQGQVHTGSIATLSNVGAGMLAPSVQYSAAIHPFLLKCADMDGDGDADLVAIGYSDTPLPSIGRVCVLLNQGAGTFVPRPPVDLPVAWPDSATTADLDGDGDIDLALAGGGLAMMLLNQGNGSLSPPVSDSLGESPVGVTSADMDGDGDIDLAVTVRDLPFTGSSSLIVLSNSGGGTFSAQVPRVRLAWDTRETIAADIDGDGDADLISLHPWSGLEVFRNRGDASFESPVRTRTGSPGYRPACLDIDGDGALDILVVGSLTDTVSVFLNLGDGALAPVVEYCAPAGLSNLTCADLDGDDRPELVTTSILGAVHVFRNCSQQNPSFCAGDGSGAACPCSNSGASGRGCENSAATGGALLAATGHAWVGNDTLVLHSEGELASSVSVVLQGTLRSSPVGFGDGLRCVSGVLKRLYIHSAVGGVLSAPQPGDPSISARSAAMGDSIQAGSTRLYQVYYRDPDPGFCPAPQGNSWNISSGLSVRWVQ